jgi:GNAT superfamily N-acetyltransferase
VTDLAIHRGGAGDAPRLLALFDDAVAWLTARGQTGQWGSEPFSAKPSNVERAQGWAASGGLWFAGGRPDEPPAGAIVLGDAHDYVPPAERPELYVQVLLTAAAWRGRGVGARLVDHAAAPAQYERLGFARVGSFRVGEWPGAILVRPL